MVQIGKVPKVWRIFVAVGAFVMLGISVWSFFGDHEGNKLVREANAAIEAGNKVSMEAVGLYKTLITDATIKDVAANRETLRPTIEQAVGLFVKATEQFRAAGSKFEEASHQFVDSPVRDYWKVKAEQLQKLAAARDALRRIVLLLADDSVKDIRSFNQKADPLADEAKKRSDESDQLGVKADKIKSDHKKEFK